MNSLFYEVFQRPSETAQDLAADILTRNGYFAERGDAFVYGEGTIPVLLVAHTDTVHRRPPTDIYCDAKAKVVWSPQGIGGDDRAGVYAIARLLADGYRPHVLFPDEEESGGAGAREAAASLLPDVNCLIELDRMHHNDAVTYECANPAWDRWIERRGWALDWGSFTDICTLMPAWGIAGVNLSVGYYNQHTTSEYVRLDQLARTIGRVARILRNPPKHLFPFMAEQRRKWYDDSLALDLDWDTNRWR